MTSEKALYATPAPSPHDGVRAAVIEECAKVADGWLATFGNVKPEYVDAQHWATDAVKDIATAIRSLSPVDTGVAINALLEKIAEKFDGWESHDIWRSDAAMVVRGFKQENGNAAISSANLSPVDTGEMERMRAACDFSLGALKMLQMAIDCGDPNRELTIRINEIEMKLRAALSHKGSLAKIRGKE